MSERDYSKFWRELQHVRAQAEKTPFDVTARALALVAEAILIHAERMEDLDSRRRAF